MSIISEQVVLGAHPGLELGHGQLTDLIVFPPGPPQEEQKNTVVVTWDGIHIGSYPLSDTISWELVHIPLLAADKITQDQLDSMVKSNEEKNKFFSGKQFDQINVKLTKDRVSFYVAEHYFKFWSTKSWPRWNSAQQLIAHLELLKLANYLGDQDVLRKLARSIATFLQDKLNRSFLQMSQNDIKQLAHYLWRDYPGQLTQVITEELPFTLLQLFLLDNMASSGLAVNKHYIYGQLPLNFIEDAGRYLFEDAGVFKLGALYQNPNLTNQFILSHQPQSPLALPYYLSTVSLIFSEATSESKFTWDLIVEHPEWQFSADAINNFQVSRLVDPEWLHQQILRFPRTLHWSVAKKHLSSSPSLTPAFLEKHIPEPIYEQGWNWIELSKNPIFNQKYIEAHTVQAGYEWQNSALIRNPSLSPAWLMEYVFPQLKQPDDIFQNPNWTYPEAVKYKNRFENEQRFEAAISYGSWMKEKDISSILNKKEHIQARYSYVADVIIPSNQNLSEKFLLEQLRFLIPLHNKNVNRDYLRQPNFTQECWKKALEIHGPDIVTKDVYTILANHPNFGISFVLKHLRDYWVWFSYTEEGEAGLRIRDSPWLDIWEYFDYLTPGIWEEIDGKQKQLIYS